MKKKKQSRESHENLDALGSNLRPTSVYFFTVTIYFPFELNKVKSTAVARPNHRAA